MLKVSMMLSWFAVSEDGCTDTLKKQLLFEDQTTIYWPTSFSPNGDNLNDVFKIEGDFIGLTDFELVIYDRWGHQVFRSNNPEYELGRQKSKWAITCFWHICLSTEVSKSPGGAEGVLR